MENVPKSRANARNAKQTTKQTKANKMISRCVTGEEMKHLQGIDFFIPNFTPRNVHWMLKVV